MRKETVAMKDEKILINEELEEVSAGGMFGGDKKQLYKVGDILIYQKNRSSARSTSLIYPVERVVVIECLGLNKGMIYDKYEYKVRNEANGRVFTAAQGDLSRR